MVASLFALSTALAQVCPGDVTFLPGAEVGVVRPNRLNEISGVAPSRRNPGVLWVHNDGPIEEIFALNTAGRILATGNLNASLDDVEDIAVGPGPTAGLHYLYIGDLGDAESDRTTVVVLRVPEPAVALDPDDPPDISLGAATAHTLAYPDGGYDAEALMVDPVSGDLFVITKQAGVGRVYRITQQQLSGGGVVTMQFITTIPLGLVSAADISPDGTFIAARREDAALMWRRSPGQTVAQALATVPVTLPLENDEPNGEALGFAADNSGYYTLSEGEDQPIYFFARNTSTYAPVRELGIADDSQLVELSGIAASRRNPGVLWVHNDGLNRRIFALRTNGTLLATYEFNQDLTDIEDIAVGPGPVSGVNYIYAGDIGDNDSDRLSIRVFRTPEPQTPQNPASGQTSFPDQTVIVLQYPDGPRDAEALLVDPQTGDLYVITKQSGSFRIYRASRAQLQSGQNVGLTFVGTGALNSVSGGDISSDGSRIILRNETEARIWTRAANQTVAQALAGVGREVPVVGTPNEPNGEGVTFRPGGYSYYTVSEGQDEPIYFFETFRAPNFSAPPQKVAGGWQLTISGCPGAVVAVEGSSNLISWQMVGTVTLTSGSGSIVDSAAGLQSRYYRLVPQ